MTKSLRLSPAQQTAFNGVRHALSLRPVVHLDSHRGLGLTTVLTALRDELPGHLLSASELTTAMRDRHPLALEEEFSRLVGGALERHQCVLVDDLDLLNSVVGGCGNYPRSNWLAASMLTLMRQADQTGRKLVLGGDLPYAVRSRVYNFGVDEFGQDDYLHLLGELLPAEIAERLAVDKIFRFAPHLNGWQLGNACRWLADESDLTTEQFIEFLRSQGMTSNVDLTEVRQVRLEDLEGIDSIRTSLETHVALPLENDELASQYGLKPKRGVLLLGPPGTGKTTIGRALAHRLRGKFFLIDGTFIAGTSSFYDRIGWVFEEAQSNAPAVIFIDDCDAIFQQGQELGLYRYLLTMLDGLESESLGRVCVMFTAMNIADLPPALIRSGRIELWLETRLPDAEARRRIFAKILRGLPDEMTPIDVERLVEVTEGFTGADLGPLVDEGKNLFAFDTAQSRPAQPGMEYLLAAAESIRTNKRRYAEALAEVRD